PEQLVIARVAAQRRAVIGRGGGGIALAAGMAGGEIAAGGGNPREVRRGLRLGGERCRAEDSGCGQCGHGRTPEAWRKDHGSSTPCRRTNACAAAALGRIDCLGPARNNCPIKTFRLPTSESPA